MRSIALTTNVKRPKVSILSGSVKIRSIGLKKTFNTPRMAAAIKALIKPSTWIPLIK
jgi:hypothetical protein